MKTKQDYIDNAIDVLSAWSDSGKIEFLNAAIFALNRAKEVFYAEIERENDDLRRSLDMQVEDEVGEVDPEAITIAAKRLESRNETTNK